MFMVCLIFSSFLILSHQCYNQMSDQKEHFELTTFYVIKITLFQLHDLFSSQLHAKTHPLLISPISESLQYTCKSPWWFNRVTINFLLARSNFLQHHHPWTFWSHFLNPAGVKYPLLVTIWLCRPHSTLKYTHRTLSDFKGKLVQMHNRNNCRLQRNSPIAYFALDGHFGFNIFVPNDHSLESLTGKFYPLQVNWFAVPFLILGKKQKNLLGTNGEISLPKDSIQPYAEL